MLPHSHNGRHGSGGARYHDRSHRGGLQQAVPGFGEVMRAVSLQVVPTAILSRQTAGICDGALVINLPGQPKAVAECLDAVFAAVPYCVDLIEGPYLETDSDHIDAFRPKR